MFFMFFRIARLCTYIQVYRWTPISWLTLDRFGRSPFSVTFPFPADQSAVRWRRVRLAYRAFTRPLYYTYAYICRLCHSHPQDQKMPSLIAFGRRWKVGSDDLILPGTALFCLHLFEWVYAFSLFFFFVRSIPVFNSNF